MSRIFFAVLLLLSVMIVLPGCGGGVADPASIDSHAEGAEATADTMDQIADALEGVKTVADAESASQQIGQWTQTLKDIAARLKELPAPTDAQMQEITRDIKPRLEAINQRLKSQSERIVQDPALAQALRDAMWDLSFTQFDFMDIKTQEERARQEQRQAQFNKPPASGPGQPAPGTIPQPQDPRGPEFTPDPDMPAMFASLVRQHGKSKAVVIVVNQPPRSGPAQLMSQLRQVVGSAQIIPAVQPTNNQTHFYIAPIDDLQALANKLPFGHVSDIDTRTRRITVDYNSGP